MILTIKYAYIGQIASKSCSPINCLHILLKISILNGIIHEPLVRNETPAHNH